MAGIDSNIKKLDSKGVNMQKVVEQKALNISRLFESLSNHAEKLAFPDYRTGIFEPKDTKNWKRFDKNIYDLSHPFTSVDTTSSFIYFSWPIIYIAQYLAFFFGLSFLYPISFNLGPMLPPTSDLGWNFLIWGLITGVPSSLVAYTWWRDFLAAKNNPWRVKVTIITITVLLLVALYWAIFMHSPFHVSWTKQGYILTLAFSSILLLIPSVSYFIAIFFDSILIILWLIKTIFGGIKSIHNPRPAEFILKLATEEIPSNQPSTIPWMLSDLPKADIAVLHNWAEANRDASEKRTVPAFLIAAIISVILSSSFVRQILDQPLSTLFMNFFSSIKEKSIIDIPIYVTIPTIVIITLLALFIRDIFKYLFALFRNIIAQNIIIEACIVVEYAIDDRDQDNALEIHEIAKTKKTWLKSFLDRLGF